VYTTAFNPAIILVGMSSTFTVAFQDDAGMFVQVALSGTGSGVFVASIAPGCPPPGGLGTGTVSLADAGCDGNGGMNLMNWTLTVTCVTAGNITATVTGNQLLPGGVFQQPLQCVPLTVTTSSPATAIGPSSAQLSGDVMSGGAPFVERGFVLAPASVTLTPMLAPGVIQPGVIQLVDPSPTGGFMTRNVTGLLPSTTYAFQAYATYGNGTIYGGVVIFITAAAVPTKGIAPAFQPPIQPGMPPEPGIVPGIKGLPLGH
jgi:hypothetical protein